MYSILPVDCQTKESVRLTCDAIVELAQLLEFKELDHCTFEFNQSYYPEAIHLANNRIIILSTSRDTNLKNILNQIRPEPVIGSYGCNEEFVFFRSTEMITFKINHRGLYLRQTIQNFKQRLNVVKMPVWLHNISMPILIDLDLSLIPDHTLIPWLLALPGLQIKIDHQLCYLACQEVPNLWIHLNFNRSIFTWLKILISHYNHLKMTIHDNTLSIEYEPNRIVNFIFLLEVTSLLDIHIFKEWLQAICLRLGIISSKCLDQHITTTVSVSAAEQEKLIATLMQAGFSLILPCLDQNQLTLSGSKVVIDRMLQELNK